MRWPPKGCQWGPNDVARAAAVKKADEAGLPASSVRHIYAFVASWTDEETGLLYASVNELRKKYRCSYANMQKMLKDLKDEKLIIIGEYVRVFSLPPGVLPEGDSEG